jgi:hypothetical protein
LAQIELVDALAQIIEQGSLYRTADKDKICSASAQDYAASKG